MIQQITKPFKYFFKLEAASGLVLLFAAILALIISNGSFSDYYFSTLEKYITLGTKEFGLKLSNGYRVWVESICIQFAAYLMWGFIFKSNVVLTFKELMQSTNHKWDHRLLSLVGKLFDLVMKSTRNFKRYPFFCIAVVHVLCKRNDRDFEYWFEFGGLSLTFDWMISQVFFACL